MPKNRKFRGQKTAALVTSSNKANSFLERVSEYTEKVTHAFSNEDRVFSPKELASAKANLQKISDQLAKNAESTLSELKSSLASDEVTSKDRQDYGVIPYENITEAKSSVDLLIRQIDSSLAKSQKESAIDKVTAFTAKSDEYTTKVAKVFASDKDLQESSIQKVASNLSKIQVKAAELIEDVDDMIEESLESELPPSEEKVDELASMYKELGDLTAKVDLLKAQAEASLSSEDDLVVLDENGVVEEDITDFEDDVVDEVEVLDDGEDLIEEASEEDIVDFEDEDEEVEVSEDMDDLEEEIVDFEDEEILEEASEEMDDIEDELEEVEMIDEEDDFEEASEEEIIEDFEEEDEVVYMEDTPQDGGELIMDDGEEEMEASEEEDYEASDDLFGLEVDSSLDDLVQDEFLNSMPEAPDFEEELESEVSAKDLKRASAAKKSSENSQDVLGGIISEHLLSR